MNLKNCIQQTIKPKEFVKEVTLIPILKFLFPDDYINSITERLSLYNKLGSLKTEEELQVFETEIIDRFGEIQLKLKIY